MRAVLAICHQKNIKIITNMGAANPMQAAKCVESIAREAGLRSLKIAIVLGDDVTNVVKHGKFALTDVFRSEEEFKDRLISANVYLGAQPIIDALEQEADVVITGRTADPSMFLAPQVHEFGWSMNNWPLLGQGTVVGHLLECAGQITGGYFADPGYKDVSGLADLGFPLAEISPDGTATITKVAGSGGIVNTATCKEQLLYEIHDPRQYMTPDVIADFSNVTLSDTGKDRVLINGGSGRQRPDTLKVSLGYRDGYLGEGQISYAGPGAVNRGRLALKIIEQRFARIGLEAQDQRYDLIGLNAIHGEALSHSETEPYEVRARVAARTESWDMASRIGSEVEALYTNGPAAGGGVTKSINEVVAIGSTLLPRDQVNYSLEYLKV